MPFATLNQPFDLTVSRRHLNDSLYNHSFDRMSGSLGLTAAKRPPVKRPVASSRPVAAAALYKAVAGFATAHLAASGGAGVLTDYFGEQVSREAASRFGLLPSRATLVRELTAFGFEQTDSLNESLSSLYDGPGKARVVMAVYDVEGNAIGLRSVTPEGIARSGIGATEGWLRVPTGSEVSVSCDLRGVVREATTGCCTSWSVLQASTYETLDAAGVECVTLIANAENADETLAAARRSHEAVATPTVCVSQPVVRQQADEAPPAVEQSATVLVSDDPTATLVDQFEQCVAASQQFRTVILTRRTQAEFERLVVDSWASRSTRSAASIAAAAERLAVFRSRYRVVTSASPVRDLPQVSWTTSPLPLRPNVLVDLTGPRRAFWWQQDMLRTVLNDAANDLGCDLVAVAAN